jgi:hypothetical protein
MAMAKCLGSVVDLAAKYSYDEFLVDVGSFSTEDQSSTVSKQIR